jgi:hypothetical protein
LFSLFFQTFFIAVLEKNAQNSAPLNAVWIEWSTYSKYFSLTTFVVFLQEGLQRG